MQKDNITKLQQTKSDIVPIVQVQKKENAKQIPQKYVSFITHSMEWDLNWPKMSWLYAQYCARYAHNSACSTLLIQLWCDFWIRMHGEADAPDLHRLITPLCISSTGSWVGLLLWVMCAAVSRRAAAECVQQPWWNNKVCWKAWTCLQVCRGLLQSIMWK